jgi:hypothetical protein
MGKHEDADLILKLYDLRREAVMRDARNWMFTFNPTSLQDVMKRWWANTAVTCAWSSRTGTWLARW